jgi:hypothetical protein
MKQIAVIILLSLSIAAQGQDKIVKKTGDVLLCTVSEIGVDEIKYYYSDRPSLIFGIDKALVDRIEFATGEVVNIDKSSFDQMDYYANQKKRALKINFLSPLSGYSEFNYEQVIRPGRTWEASLGIVGLGFDPAERDPRGAFAKFAYKFSRTPDYYMSKMHYSHILKGAYFAPEVAFRFCSFEDYRGWFNEDREKVDEYAIAFTLKIGKQWVFDNFLLIDLYGGMGYGVSSQDYHYVNYGFFAGNGDFPIAFTSGFRVGILF